MFKFTSRHFVVGEYHTWSYHFIRPFLIHDRILVILFFDVFKGAESPSTFVKKVLDEFVEVVFEVVNIELILQFEFVGFE